MTYFRVEQTHLPDFVNLQASIILPEDAWNGNFDKTDRRQAIEMIGVKKYTHPKGIVRYYLGSSCMLQAGHTSIYVNTKSFFQSCVIAYFLMNPQADHEQKSIELAHTLLQALNMPPPLLLTIEKVNDIFLTLNELIKKPILPDLGSFILS